MSTHSDPVADAGGQSEAHASTFDHDFADKHRTHVPIEARPGFTKFIRQYDDYEGASAFGFRNMPAKRASQPKAKRKAAEKKDPWRPTVMTEPVKAAICAWIAQGRSLAAWCREDGTDYSTVTHHLRHDQAFFANYTQAREDSADADADVVTDLRAQVLAGDITPEQARVAIDAAKWTAGKRQPKKYGDRLDLNHSGEIRQHLTLEQYRERVALAKSRAKAVTDSAA